MDGPEILPLPLLSFTCSFHPCSSDLKYLSSSRSRALIFFLEVSWRRGWNTGQEMNHMCVFFLIFFFYKWRTSFDMGCQKCSRMRQSQFPSEDALEHHLSLLQWRRLIFFFFFGSSRHRRCHWESWHHGGTGICFWLTVASRSWRREGIYFALLG